ncbi:MAG: hypothetical protein Q4C96_00375 [Planctomycetia bacterium]|nr:hypothetical protein [Planctomycetia bacterium]
MFWPEKNHTLQAQYFIPERTEVSDPMRERSVPLISSQEHSPGISYTPGMDTESGNDRESLDSETGNAHVRRESVYGEVSGPKIGLQEILGRDKKTEIINGKNTGDVSSISAKDYPWIFIPVDKNNVPTGEDYYIPLDMFRHLHNGLSEGNIKKSEDYKFRKASYHGQLRFSSSSAETLTLDTVTASYELETFSENTRIYLPMLASEIYLSAGGASLNGYPLQAIWENGKLAFDIPRAGIYVLEIRFFSVLNNESSLTARTPASSSKKTVSESISEYQGEIQFSIPPVANSRLILEVPPNSGEIDFPSAKGKISYQASSQRWQVQLGDANKVKVRWKKPIPPETFSSSMNVEEFYHWIITPKGMTLQCRYRYRIQKKNQTYLEWITEPHALIQKLPVQNNESVNVFSLPYESGREMGKNERTVMGNSAQGGIFLTDERVVVRSSVGERNLSDEISRTEEMVSQNMLFPVLKTYAEDARQKIRMDFSSPLEGQVVLGFDVQFPHVSVIGKHLFPWIYPSDVKSIRRWIAVSVMDLEGELKYLSAPSVTELTIPEFMSVWTDINSILKLGQPKERAINPKFVRDDTSLKNIISRTWYMETIPGKPVYPVTETQSLLCLLDRIHVQYVAAFSSVDAMPFFCHLNVPENFQPKRMVLREKNRELPVRYRWISPTELGVYLDNSVTERVLGENRFLQSNSQTTILPSLKVPPAPQLILEGEIALPVMGETENLSEGNEEKDFGEKNKKRDCEIPLFRITLKDDFFTFSSRRVKIYRGSETLLDFKDLPDEVLSRSSFASFGILEKEDSAVKPPVSSEREASDFSNGGGTVYLTENTGEGFRNAQLSASLSYLENEDIKGKIIIKANSPRVEIRQRTSLIMDEKEDVSPTEGTSRVVGNGNHGNKESWSFRMEILLDVKDGLLDEFTLDLPYNWKGPFSLEPAIPFSISEYEKRKSSVYNPVTFSLHSGIKKEKVTFSTEENSEENVLGQETRKRMIIRPFHPFRGKQKIIITGSAREIQNALIKEEVSYVFPRVYFPEGVVIQEDFVMPEFSENMKMEGKVLEWNVEGMDLVQVSSLEGETVDVKKTDIPETGKTEEKRGIAETEEAEPRMVKLAEESSLYEEEKHQKREELSKREGTVGSGRKGSAQTVIEADSSRIYTQPGVRKIYRAREKNYMARLLITSVAPPKVQQLWVSHHLSWNSFQKKSGDINFLLLSVFDILPHQASHCVVVLPEMVSPLEFRMDGFPTQVKRLSSSEISGENILPGYNYYQVSFYSGFLPKRLEVLSRGHVKRRSVPVNADSSVPSGITSREASFVSLLQFPFLYNAVFPEDKEDNNVHGSCYVYLPEACDVRMWKWKDARAVTRISARSLLRIELDCMNYLFRMMQRASESDKIKDTEVFSPEMAENLPEEFIIWRRFWEMIWQRKVSYVSQLLQHQRRNDLREYMQDFEGLREKGEKLFSGVNSVFAGKFLENRPSVTQWKPLEETFRESLFPASSSDVQRMVPGAELLVFDFENPEETARNLRNSSAVHELFLTELISSSGIHDTLNFINPAWRSEHFYAAIFVFALTILFALGIHFFPAVLDITYTTPYWLLVCGFLWLLCDFPVWWVAIFLFLMAVFIVVWRARNVVRKN